MKERRGLSLFRESIHPIVVPCNVTKHSSPRKYFIFSPPCKIRIELLVLYMCEAEQLATSDSKRSAKTRCALYTSVCCVLCAQTSHPVL
jgi:hypothetical protein